MYQQKNINFYKKAFYYLPLILTILNSLLFLEDYKHSVLAIVKGLVILGVVIVGFGFYLRHTKITTILLILLFYWFFLTLFSSSFITSIWFLLKVILSILLIPIGISISKESIDYRLLYKSTLYILLYSNFFAIISNIFHIGLNQYARNTDTVRVGLIDAQLYTPALSIVAMLFLMDRLDFSKRKRAYLFILIVVTFIMLLLSMRRTTIIIVVLGAIFYYFYSKQLYKQIKDVFIFILFLILLLPFYQDYLIERYQLREKVINKDYQIEEEYRYRETFILFNDILESNSLKRVLFGKELFNSAGKYGDGIFKDRILHVDYNEILFGSGIVGLFIYLLIYYKLFKMNLKIPNLFSRSIFKTFILLSLIISFSGQMYEVSFRSYLFVIIGSIIGLEKVVTKSVSKNRL